VSIKALTRCPRGGSYSIYKHICPGGAGDLIAGGCVSAPPASKCELISTWWGFESVGGLAHKPPTDAAERCKIVERATRRRVTRTLGVADAAPDGDLAPGAQVVATLMGGVDGCSTADTLSAPSCPRHQVTRICPWNVIGAVH
jgi:hypothetical protein